MGGLHLDVMAESPANRLRDAFLARAILCELKARAKERKLNSQGTNLFLSSLSPASCDSLISRSTFVELPIRTVLYEGIRQTNAC